MSEMVKRVAKALAALPSSQREGGPTYDQYARAAIEAMREPTPQMLATFADGDDPAYAEDWRTMIDAALE